MPPRFGLPIRGPLHPKGWVRPAGNTDMVITQTAADHIARGGPPALDIGDGAPDLDEILAPHASSVGQALTIGSANLSLDFIDEDGRKCRIVLAHNTLPHPVAQNQQVALGQVVGRMGNTSSPTMPVSIHLHIQIGYWNGTSYTWVDPEPLLNQNSGGDMIPIPGANYKRLANKKTSLITLGNFRSERKSGAILKKFPSGTVIYPVAYANDGDVPTGSQSGEWFYCLLYDDSPAGFIGGWFHSSLVGPLVDDVTGGGGFTQAQLDAAVKAAADPLNARIAGIKQKVAAGAVDIADD
jgi:hypothetical protein